MSGYGTLGSNPCRRPQPCSRNSRDHLGDEATSDLVAWVDGAAARELAQLRELADLHYARFEARLEQRLAEVQASLRVEMALGRSDLIKWMFVFWAGTVLPLAGLMVALIKL